MSFVVNRRLHWCRAYSPTDCQKKNKLFFEPFFDLIHLRIFGGRKKRNQKFSIMGQWTVANMAQFGKTRWRGTRFTFHWEFQRATSCKIGTRCPKLSGSLSKTQACKTKKLCFPLVSRSALHHSCIIMHLQVNPDILIFQWFWDIGFSIAKVDLYQNHIPTPYLNYSKEIIPEKIFHYVTSYPGIID